MSAPGQPAEPHSRTRREWFVLGVGTIVVAVLCLLAGQWQWNRHQVRSAQIDLVITNFDAAPVPVQELLPGPGAKLSPGDVWRPVTMSGSYVPQDTVLLRNRPVDSTAGFHVLVPFEVSGSDLVLIVDRGFVPIGVDSSGPDMLPPPPPGPVSVTARLRPDEARSSRGAPAGQIQSINTRAVLETSPSGGGWADERVTEAYAALITEDPAPAQGLRRLPPASRDLGSHLSYTFQWIVFAAGAIGGFIVLLRRERREAIRRRAEAFGPTHMPAGTPEDVAAWIVGAQGTETPPRTRRRTSDEDSEDAHLDSQGFF